MEIRTRGSRFRSIKWPDHNSVNQWRNTLSGARLVRGYDINPRILALLRHPDSLARDYELTARIENYIIKLSRDQRAFGRWAVPPHNAPDLEIEDSPLLRASEILPEQHLAFGPSGPYRHLTPLCLRVNPNFNSDVRRSTFLERVSYSVPYTLTIQLERPRTLHGVGITYTPFDRFPGTIIGVEVGTLLELKTFPKLGSFQREAAFYKHVRMNTASPFLDHRYEEPALVQEGSSYYRQREHDSLSLSNGPRQEEEDTDYDHSSSDSLSTENVTREHWNRLAVVEGSERAREVVDEGLHRVTMDHKTLDSLDVIESDIDCRYSPLFVGFINLQRPPFGETRHEIIANGWVRFSPVVGDCIRLTFDNPDARVVFVHAAARVSPWETCGWLIKLLLLLQNGMATLTPPSVAEAFEKLSREEPVDLVNTWILTVGNSSGNWNPGMAALLYRLAFLGVPIQNLAGLPSSKSDESTEAMRGVKNKCSRHGSTVAPNLKLHPVVGEVLKYI